MAKKYTLTLSKRDLVFLRDALITARGLYAQYNALQIGDMHWQDRIKRADKLRDYINKVRTEQNK